MTPLVKGIKVKVMIIVVIALSILGILISLIYGLNGPQASSKGIHPPRKYQYFITYLLSILAVFIGAFLALYISDLYTQKKEKEYLQDLLLRTNTELKDESVSMRMLYDYYTEQSPDEAEYRMNGNPVQDIFGLYIIINSPEFSKYITPGDAMLVQQFIRQKEKLRIAMNNPEVKLETRIRGYDLYSKTLEDINLMLSLESDFLEGDISYKELLDSLSDDANFVNNDELKGYFDDRQYGTEIPLPKHQ